MANKLRDIFSPDSDYNKQMAKQIEQLERQMKEDKHWQPKEDGINGK